FDRRDRTLYIERHRWILHRFSCYRRTGARRHVAGEAAYANLTSHFGCPPRAPPADGYQLPREQAAWAIVVACLALKLQTVLAVGAFHVRRVFLQVHLGCILNIAQGNGGRILDIQFFWLGTQRLP